MASTPTPPVSVDDVLQRLHLGVPAAELLDNFNVDHINDHGAFNGRTLLFQAILLYHDAHLAVLLTVPTINVNRCTASGQTPLCAAILHNNAEAIKCLLDHPDICCDEAGSDTKTPLYYAILNHTPNQSDNVSFLVAHLLAQPKVNVNAIEQCHQTSILHLAIERKLLMLVHLLLVRPEILVNVVTSQGTTPLMLAVLYGDLFCLKLLLAHPQLDHQMVDLAGHTALHHALLNDRYSCTTMLLSHSSVTLHQRDRHGHTPLHLAVISSPPNNCVALLLQQPGIQLNTFNHQGRTPLYSAIIMGHLRIVTLLFTHPGLALDVFPAICLWDTPTKPCTTYYELAQQLPRGVSVHADRDQKPLIILLQPPPFWHPALRPGLLPPRVQQRVGQIWQLVWRRPSGWQCLPLELVSLILLHLESY